MIYHYVQVYLQQSGKLNRVSLSLLILHLVIMILMFTRDSFAKFVNEECFLVKFLVVLGLTFIFLFFDNSWMLLYLKIASYVSIVFLLYQSIVIIDFGYVWNETWRDKMDEGTTFYGILLILFTLILATANFGMIYLNIQNFWISGCFYNKFNIIMNCVIIIAIVALVFLKYNENSSILTAFFITLIFSYYNGISLSSYNDKVCNPFENQQQIYQSFVYGFLFHFCINFLLGVLTTVFVSISEQSSQAIQDMNIQTVQRDSNSQTGDNEQRNENLVDSQNQKVQIYKNNTYIYYHLMMAFFSVYLVMIFFDWRELNLDFDKWTELSNRSTSGFLIKTFNSIIFLLFYLWTLLAPFLFIDSEREFD